MKIITTPNSYLRHTAKPVSTITKKTLSEIKEMISTLKAATDPEGVGLAATQVGIDKRIFILLQANKATVHINPKITSLSKLTVADKYPDEDKRPLEGCLSIPRIWGFVNRPYRVKVEYQTLDPESNSTITKIVKKKLEGFRAIAFQHETDHLNGILFTDHILKQNGTILKETPNGLRPIKLNLDSF